MRAFQLSRNPVTGRQFALVAGPVGIRVWTRMYARVTLCAFAFGHVAYLHIGDPS